MADLLNAMGGANAINPEPSFVYAQFVAVIGIEFLRNRASLELRNETPLRIRSELFDHALV